MAKDPRWQLASRLPYFVGAFEDQADATAFYTALGERLGTFKLALAAETTRIIACPRQQSQTSFEFLGFECR
jgi:hypothetical protein